jgi:hypothetical protein
MATRAEITVMVLAKIDELETMTGASQSPADGLIDKLMDGSCLNMLRNAPLTMLKPDKLNVAAPAFIHIKYTTKGYGHIALPLDFLRLYSFKLVAWNRPVIEPISTSNPLYKKQKNIAARGGMDKPIAVLGYVDTSNGISEIIVDEAPEI